MMIIDRTKGITVAFNGEQYTIAEDIYLAGEPTEDFPQEPHAQVQSISNPDAILEMFWEPMLSPEFDDWISSGDFNKNIHGIVSTTGD